MPPPFHSTTVNPTVAGFRYSGYTVTDAYLLVSSSPPVSGEEGGRETEGLRHRNGYLSQRLDLASC